nr:DUF4271 domain-containing protein [Aequorivita echinoideorum]
MLVSCLFLFAAAKYFYPRRFDEFVMLLITNKYFLVHGKNDEINHPFNILLFISQVISVSLFFYLVLKAVAPEETAGNPWLFVQICTAYTVFVLAKFSIEKIIGNVFSIDPLINQYLYQKLSYRNFLAIFLFIGNLFFLYVLPQTVIGLSIFIAIVLVFNAIALFYSYKNYGNMILGNFFYFILYLCALEISPYIILYKSFV